MPPSPSAASAPRFLADAMLGRLARWLRALGHDTAYDPEVHDPGLVAWAAREGRVLLTRDRHLVAHLRPERAHLVRADAPLDQLTEVVDACTLRVDPDRLFTRCLVCNAALEEVAGQAALALVPPRACGLPGPVRRCPVCGRVYWPGSHVRRMRETLARAFPQALGG